MLSVFFQSVLRFYKRWLSPMLPASCRFEPTCSEYAAQAIEQHGALLGGALAFWRLLRCQPLARAGYDPVPSLSSLHRNHPHCQPTGAASRLSADC
jgi:putative membrane protein insertion efficiency factor